MNPRIRIAAAFNDGLLPDPESLPEIQPKHGAPRSTPAWNLQRLMSCDDEGQPIKASAVTPPVTAIGFGSEALDVASTG